MSDLRTLAEAATPGPWTPDEWHGSDDGGWRAVGPLHEQPENDEPDCDAHQRAKRDSAFIAAANPTAILALLDRVERLERVAEAAVAWRKAPWLVDGSSATWCGALARMERAVDEYIAALEVDRG